MSNLLWLTPLISVAVALAMLVVHDRRVLSLLDLCGAFAVLILGLVIARDVGVHGPSQSGLLRADALAVVFLLLLGLIAVSVAIYSVGWMKGEVDSGHLPLKQVRYYFALVHGFIATMVVTVLADNLGVLWIAMEGTTITSAILVGFRGNQHGLEAAWKYIIVTTVGIAFGLFGTVLIYAAAAHTQGGVFTGAMSWVSIATISKQLDPAIVRIGFIFVMIGYGTKAGLAPMHMWLPDAHSQAPTPVSALLSGALIKCAIFGIIRFHIIARAACGPEFSGELLLIFGLVSVVVATPFILAQHDVKRLLGYHSVEHIGIVALGLGFGGHLGVYGALLHVINHGVTKALVFLGAGELIARYHSRDMRTIRGYFGVAPVGATLLLFGTLSLAGLPPFSIFVSELLVVAAGINAGHMFAVGIFLLMLLIIFAGLIHHVGEMVFGTASAEVSREREQVSPLVGMMLLAALMLALGLFIPVPLDQLLTQAVEVVLD